MQIDLKDIQTAIAQADIGSDDPAGLPPIGAYEAHARAVQKLIEKANV